MNPVTLNRDGLALRGRDAGAQAGAAVVFQHGLGGDEAQVAESFPADAPVRRLTLECRGHGGGLLGEPAQLSLATFAGDVLAFADQQQAARFIAGGISMGAAIALRLAVTAPARVRALVLVRPAWLCEPAPAAMQVFAVVAGFLREPDAQRGLAHFDASPAARELAVTGPDNLVSLRKFFQAPDRASLATLLERIAQDGPGVGESDLRALEVPTLVVGHALDAVHPWAYAQWLAARIPGARLVETTPKATDKPRYLDDLRAALSAFFAETLETPA